MSYTVSRTYITPILSDGTLQQPTSETTFANSRGVFTLTAGALYYFVLPVGGSTLIDVQLTHDAAIAITSAEIETCSHDRLDVSDYSAIGGEWIGQNPPGAYVPVEGAGDTATNGVLAVVAGNAGGADWQSADCAGQRARLAVQVGATGGEVRVSFVGKE